MNFDEAEQGFSTSRLRAEDEDVEPGRLTRSPNDVSGLVAKLLDESEAIEFRNAERILDALERQGETIAGYPRVRPPDCSEFLDAMRRVFDAYRRAFIIADPRIVGRFVDILAAFEKTDVRAYPRELMLTRVLEAEARLLLDDPAGARALIRSYADRIYKIEGDRDEILKILRLDCEAQAALGEVDDLGSVALQRAKAAMRLWPRSAVKVASALADFLGFDSPPRPDETTLARLMGRAARMASRARLPGGTPLRRARRSAVVALGVAAAGACLYLMRWRRSAMRRDVVVTRAMGGIGDLLIMTAGLRALSKRHGTKVKLVIERKFFDLFRNNPHVEVVDIDGPPVDVAACGLWRNLTLCPAARYESRRRPFVRKGRAELFAAGMGVGRRLLDAYGWGVDYALDEAQIRFRDDFLRERGLGRRPIVGVQPYARDSYKDHPRIERFVAALSARYDLVLFHHLETSFTDAPSIASTAGLPLAQSLALVSSLDAMVCVDSAFLHAGAAFDVPVVALFGPTDGELFTRQHSDATLVTMNDSFACAPCWRNEDLPCSLTGAYGPSPCVAAIKVEPVLLAVEGALRRRRERKR